MFRIDNSTAVASLPVAPPAGVGGYFTKGNPIAAQPATVVDEWWTNMMQEEIVTVVLNAGLTLNKNDRTQLYQAIQRLIGVGVGTGEDYDPFLPLVGGTLYAGASNDLLTIQVDQGYYARVRYTVAGVRSWTAGVFASGYFAIADETASSVRMIIGLDGKVNCNFGLAVAGLISANQLNIAGGPINADGTITTQSNLIAANSVIGNNSVVAHGSLFSDHFVYAGTGGAAWYDGANNGQYLSTNSGVIVNSANGINATLLTVSTINLNGNLTVGGGVLFAGGTNILQWNNAGYLYDYGNFGVTGSAVIGGNLGVNNSLSVSGNIAATYNVTCNAIGISGNCTIGGSVGISGGITMAGDISANNFTVHGALQMGLSAGISGSVTIAGDMSCNYATVHNGLSVGMSVGIAGGLTVSGDGSCNNFTANGESVAGLKVYSYGPVYGTAFVQTSDRRTKENIADLDSQLAGIRSLRPISYDVIGETEDTGRHYGFLAQEVAEGPLADLVIHSTNPHPRAPEGLLGIDVGSLLASAVGAIKELDARLSQLEAGGK